MNAYDALRVYEPDECGRDGYPLAWHRCPDCNGTGWRCATSDLPMDDRRGTCCCNAGEPCPSANGCPSCWVPGQCGGTGAVERMVRALADYRCIRCQHPYRSGAGEWSRCDEHCAHGGPIRVEAKPGEWTYPPDHGDVRGWAVNRVCVQAAWRILTVHHLRLGADAKRDLRWWNLAALCQRCHLQIQGKVVMERIWPWPHSDWFKPYAAGWYAWAYLGENLSRDEVDARMDELLALEAVA